MEYNHTRKIVETYQKLLALDSPAKQPNKQLLDIILDMYSFAYAAGEQEERQRVHFFHPELIDKEQLLKQCNGEISVDEEDDEDGDEEFWELVKSLNSKKN